MAAVESLLAGVKQFLAELSDDQWNALVTEVREPQEPAQKQPQPIALNDDRALANIIGAHLSGRL